MPRSVRVASVAVFLLGLLSALYYYAIHGRTVAGPLRIALPLLVLLGMMWALRGFSRRQERARMAALVIGWILAILLGVSVLLVAMMVMSSTAISRSQVLYVVGMLLVLGVPVTVVWSLSRPSARGWFTPDA